MNFLSTLDQEQRVAKDDQSSSKGLSRSWAILGIVYAAFFYWYTSFGGPLTDEEIAHFTKVLASAPDMSAHSERWIHFMESDTGDDFAMWNAVDLFDTPRQVEGVEPGETSEDVVNRYSEPFFARALRRASHPVMGGAAANTAIDIWGIEGGADWDMGLLVRYRSRRDIMEMIEELSRSGSEIHSFKVAAVEKTIAFPLDPWAQAGDPRLLLAMIFTLLGLASQLRHNARTQAPDFV
ncbi:MAG: hypothetical protein HRU01_16520 [Myxococcales bacterium]|nr:hypothetical protein [Myxococcales bacterium]